LFLAALLRVGWQVLRSAWYGNAAALAFLVGLGTALAVLGVTEGKGDSSCHDHPLRSTAESCGGAHGRAPMIAGIAIVTLALLGWLHAMHRTHDVTTVRPRGQ
jgi:hypothetical protein